MSGHNKWSTIKHKKGAADAKKGKLWSKIAKEIVIAVKEGGSDETANPRLRLSIAKAKQANMPNDNVDRAIKRASGEDKDTTYEEFTYEGYGPAGVAVMLDIMTDNKNRTAAEIRSIFTKSGGSLGENGCVAWSFDRKSLITVDATKYDEDTVMEVAIEAGAEDVTRDGDTFNVTGEMDVFSDLVDAFKAKGIETQNAEVTRIPKSTVDVSPDDAKKVIRMMEAFEDHDDVQSVSANFNIDDEVLASLDA